MITFLYLDFREICNLLVSFHVYDLPNYQINKKRIFILLPFSTYDISTWTQRNMFYPICTRDQLHGPHGAKHNTGLHVAYSRVHRVVRLPSWEDYSTHVIAESITLRGTDLWWGSVLITESVRPECAYIVEIRGCWRNYNYFRLHASIISRSRCRSTT